MEYDDNTDDYQGQLRLLEIQNRRRLMMARTEAALGLRRVPSISSDSSAEDMNGLSNGVGHVTLNGKPAAENDKAEAEAEEEQDPDKTVYKPGMKNGLKQLYSGKEDKKGRFQWQNTIPKDIGEAAENDKTAKWALLVRNVKVYNDPRRVLSIHSIVVQSPLLKKLLMSVLKGYPGVTVGLNRLEFEGKFEPLIHRWAELQEAIAKLSDETGDQPAVEVPAKCNGVEEQEASRKLGEEAEVQQPAEAVAKGNGVDDQEATSKLEKEAEDRRTTKAHAELLQEVLVKEFKTLIDSSQDMKSKRVMTYEHLWTLFQPGSTVRATASPLSTLTGTGPSSVLPR
jgi:hypothetical protein